MLQTNIVLFVMLFCLAVSVSVQASDSIETAGDVLLIILPATAAGLTVGFKDTKGALQFGESAALTLGVTYGLKYAIKEERPNGGSHSFPSAHTSISFASAEFMRKRYGWKYGIPAYAAAFFVAYSRVDARQHYTHDVLAGAAIGIGSSYLFTNAYEGWNIQAEADHKYYGVRLSHIW
ncbi:MAG: phosphatase PAP2 family protein [Nitrospirae bacterium]|nr:phosphatase PAP2 family protein [Nitrospirota bacterium]